MTPGRTLHTRDNDPVRNVWIAFRNAVVFSAVIWAAIVAMLWWAL